MSDNDKTTDRTTDRPGADRDPGARPVDASSTSSEPPAGHAGMVGDDDLDLHLDDAVPVTRGGAAEPAGDVPPGDAGPATAVPVARGVAAEPADDSAAGDDAPGGPAEPATEHLDLYALTGRAAPKRIDPLPQTGSYAAADADFAGRDEPEQEPDAVTETAPAAGAAAPADPRGAGETTVMGIPADARDDRPAAADDAAPYAAEPRDGGALDADPAADPRRGTLDLGLLLLRLGVGGLLLLHGLATFFAFGGSAGMAGLQQRFSGSGYAYASTLSVAVPTLEVIAGGLLVLGLATPLGAAIALALSAFLTMSEVAAGPGAGWNLLGEGSAAAQVQLLLTAGALALQFTGPGRYGLDFSRRWSRRPLASSWIFCVLAVAAAVAAWWAVTGTVPFARAVG